MTLSEFLGQLNGQLGALREERDAVQGALAELRKIVGDTIPAAGGYRVSSETDRERTQQRIEEYKFLRLELESIWGQTYATLNFILAAIALIITAAYSSNGDPAILLPMASLLTLGAYGLIRIHTKRVWRIVGYMRRALESKLTGIRWETRLAARHGLVKEHFDDNIFDGHLWVLDLTNILLLVGIVWCGFGGSKIAGNIESGAAKAGLVAGCSLAPIGMLLASRLIRRDLRRGESLETEQMESWGLCMADGKPVSVAGPPHEWRAESEAPYKHTDAHA